MSAPYYQDDRVILYHGDCLEIDEWLKADVLVTDPPYGIGWTQGDYSHGGKYVGNTPHAGIANDADTAVRDSALAKWGGIKPALTFGAPMGIAPANAKQMLVWQKSPDSGVFGSVGGWRRDWEAVYLLGNWLSIPAARSSVVVTRRGLQSFITGGHPHMKPVALLEYLITNCPSGVVADPFAGSGSTLVAARNLGRKVIGVEIEERYCEMTARRLDQLALDFGSTA